jgi:hypothetical protein
MTAMEATERDGDIREQAAQYLSGVLSREAFEEWFVANTWDERTSLACELDHLLAEAAVLGGRFDDELGNLVRTVRVGSVTPRTSSAMTTSWERPMVSVRTRTIIAGPMAFAGT